MVVRHTTDGLHNPDFQSDYRFLYKGEFWYYVEHIFLSLNEMQHHVEQHSLWNSNGERQ